MKARPATEEFIRWFKQELTRHTALARKIIKLGDEHVPMMFIYAMDGALAMVPVPQFFGNARGKDLVSILHQEISNDDLVKCAILVTESWVVNTKRSDPGFDEAVKSIDMTKSLADHPNRQEAITYNAVQKGMQLIASFLIDRPTNTLADKPMSIVDPQAGILEGEGKDEGMSVAMGRMVLPRNDNEEH